ncbi:hypothetical protein [Tranquillimonas rosea]|uniref:hypothetical protein n=1 Tax=Tranquillimonas rosea TaxID=641238 RepID=UPI003BAAE0FA
MKTLIVSAALGLTAIAGAAQANPQLEAAAQQKFDRYNVAADASALSEAQLAEIQFIETDDTAAGASTRALLTQAASR